MDAVAALYSDRDVELSEAIIASLSRALFGVVSGAPAGLFQRLLSRLSHRVLKWTTTHEKTDDQSGGTGSFRNPILERTGHPYAQALLNSSTKDTEALIEGGDPMNGPYMMISPEILGISDVWDRLLMHSVQGKDVQLRFVRETQATYEAARSLLEKGVSIRMKAVAAGTGLSMILAYDRLVNDGHDPARMTIRITDRDRSNVDKAQRLLAKLTSTRSSVTNAETEGGISVGTEDLFGEPPASATNGEARYHVVTAVGILDYLPGFTCATTERSLRLPQLEEVMQAEHLALRLGHMTEVDGVLIVNTYRPHASTRILELFGRRFDYRHRENLSALLATAGFGAPRLVGSGHIYDVVAYIKSGSQTP
ncbi:MAG: hypothetical protein ABIR71_12630 [Chthoniobacterales bacterium]